MDARAKAGFTLIELVIVIGIIGILSAIAIPTYRGVRADAELIEVVSDIRNLQSLAVIYMEDKGTPPTLDQLDEMYRRSGKDSIVGEYTILINSEDGNNGHGNDWDGWDDGNPGVGGANGLPAPSEYAPKFFLIFSTRELPKYEYIFGMDDNPLVRVPDGQDPLNIDQFL